MIHRSVIVSHVLLWLCETLVRALLRGVWRFVVGLEGAAQDRAFARFSALVNSADCFPCRIEWHHPRDMDARALRGEALGPCLVILAGTAASEGIWEEFGS